MARAAESEIPNLVRVVSPHSRRPDSPLVKESLFREFVCESKRFWKLLSDVESPVVTRVVTEVTDTDTEPESNSSQSWVRVIVSDDEAEMQAKASESGEGPRLLRSASTQTDWSGSSTCFTADAECRPEVVWTPMLTTCYLPQLRYADGQLVPLLDTPLVQRPPRV